MGKKMYFYLNIKRGAFLVKMPAYEIIFRAPHEIDWTTQLSRERQTNLKPADDWNDHHLNTEDNYFINCCSHIRQIVRNIWKKDDGKNFKYFFEVEHGEERHCHILLEHPDLTSRNLQFPVKEICNKLSARLNCPITKECFTVTKKHCRKTRKDIVRDIHFESYVFNYYYSKPGPTLISTVITAEADEEEKRDNCCLWAWTNVLDLQDSVRNEPERKRLHEGFKKPEEPVAKPVSEPVPGESGSRPLFTVPTKAQQRFMDIIDWLVNNAITSERQWATLDRTTYLALLASTSGKGQIKRALEQASHMMKQTMSASDYLVGKTIPTEEEIKDNRVYKILTLNNYDPAYVARLMYGWINLQYGKRNTLWFYGPATTGKTIIAQAIAESVPFYAGVNWTNENFPFCNCPGKMLIWWEEGKMTQKIVETAKCLLGGTRVPVDVKCKMAEICEPTPVVITSNTNMCQVFDGNSSSFEHTEPLQERMFKVRLNHKLPPTFGKVTKKEIQDFFAWGSKQEIDIKHVFETPKTTPLQESIKKMALPVAASQSTAAIGEKRRADEELPGPSPKQVKPTNKTTVVCNNIEERASIIELAETNQCLLHQQFHCIECYPELLDHMAGLLEDVLDEQ